MLGNKLQPFRRSVFGAGWSGLIFDEVQWFTRWHSANLDSRQERNTMTIPRGVGL